MSTRKLGTFDLSRVTRDELLVHGMQAFCDTRRRVGLSDGTPEEFYWRFTLWVKCPGHVFVGVRKNRKLATFLSITEVDDWVEIEGCFSMNKFLNLSPNDTLMFAALSHYLVQKKVRLVSYGLSSIQEESKGKGLHFYKVKVGIKAVSVHRVFVFNPLLRPFANRITLVHQYGSSFRSRESAT